MDFEDGDQDEEDYEGDGGMWGGGERSRERGRVTTRLVVPRMHVGCLLGKGGKIIEQMRNETRTHIRILPRDQYTPRCVSMSEEVVQVFGEGSCVKKALVNISSRLKESLHRERGPFRGRIHSPEGHFVPDDDFISNTHHQPAFERGDLVPITSLGPTRARSSVYGSESKYIFDPDANAMIDRPQSFSSEDIVFRILCPNDKVEAIIGSPNGISEMLQNDVGVDVRVTDPVEGSEERIIVITSDEGPDDELFPAQEALLHVQTHIVDLGPDKDNVITTRLLIQDHEIGCLEGKDGSLSDFQRLTCANVQVLPKEELPLCAFETDELIQIVGEIRAARKALVQVTTKLRSYLYRDISTLDDTIAPSFPATSLVGKVVGLDSSSTRSLSREGYQGSDPPIASFENVRASSVNWSSKDLAIGASGPLEPEQNCINDIGRQSSLKRFSASLVTKSTLEVVIPDDAVSSLITKSGSKLAQISEMSGATMTLLEDRPDSSDKVVQISGTPEQAERAQSLLQGFILSLL
ncbi:KH domain-containing protein [Dendrobium catenatum]|uniref:KH domain-containing protein n=2 Tax=Dendrobium catenatum TaxID=906689 RepID=A0A2I0V9L5_9ASPA|nr:KH domain-containing protein [Dendrobium catenatum]